MSLRIVFMGTPDFAVPALKALAQSEHEVIAVVSQPDKPKGRGKTMLPPPVKETALQYELPVYQPLKVRDPEFIAELEKMAPDLIVVAAFGQIIPQKILDLPRIACINIHGSLLPKYRGAAPIQQCILDGEKETGITIMKMAMGLDTGDMISKKVVPITEEETGGSLFDKMAAAGAGLLLETLPSLENGTAVFEKQPEESPTPYAAMITKEMGLMDFTKDAIVLERLVRGLNPWPSAFTYLHGKTLKIWKCEIQKENGAEDCGIVYKTDKKGIYVSCGNHSLLLTEVQLEGKKRMDAAAFLRGYHIEEGTRLLSVRE